VVHASILLLVLFSPRLERTELRPAEQQPSRVVQMMYLPSQEDPPRPERQPPAKPPRPPLPPAAPSMAEAAAPTKSEPGAPTRTNVPAPEHDDPAATSPQPTNQSGGLEREDAMVTEARRLFGPSPRPAGTLAGPVRTGLPLGLLSGGSRCVLHDAEARTIDHPAEGVIEGIVRTETGGRPIAGAFLQMLGTGSATFADASGHYRLSFDPSLVDACRSQVVRVTAPGYRARTMILTLGRRSDNAIDMVGK
jgi:hypothetical protein